MRFPTHALTRTETMTIAWLRSHVFDVILLALGTFVTLRFWFVVFGVENRFFMRTVGLLAAAAVVKRIVVARRGFTRPCLFTANRRFDLVASLALATTPWPITLPLNAASPLWSMVPAALVAAWVQPMIAALIIAGGLRQLASKPR